MQTYKPITVHVRAQQLTVDTFPHMLEVLFEAGYDIELMMAFKTQEASGLIYWKGDQAFILKLNDYLVQHHDGSFEAFTYHRFNQVYEKVDYL